MCKQLVLLKNTNTTSTYMYLQTAEYLEARGRLGSCILEQEQPAEAKLMGFHEHAILEPGEVPLWRRCTNGAFCRTPKCILLFSSLILVRLRALLQRFDGLSILYRTRHFSK